MSLWVLTAGKMILKTPLAKQAIAAGVAYTGIRAVLGETATNATINLLSKPTPLPLRRFVASILDNLSPMKGFSFKKWNTVMESLERSAGRKAPSKGIELDLSEVFK